jgi:hypothetical protein
LSYNENDKPVHGLYICFIASEWRLQKGLLILSLMEQKMVFVFIIDPEIGDSNRSMTRIQQRKTDSMREIEACVSFNDILFPNANDLLFIDGDQNIRCSLAMKRVISL